MNFKRKEYKRLEEHQWRWGRGRYNKTMEKGDGGDVNQNFLFFRETTRSQGGGRITVTMTVPRVGRLKGEGDNERWKIKKKKSNNKRKSAVFSARENRSKGG